MPGGFVGAGRIGSLGCALGAWVLLLLALCVVLWPWAGCVGVFVCVCVCVYMCMGGLSVSIFQRCFASIGKMIVFELLSCLGTRQATYVYHVYY